MNTPSRTPGVCRIDQPAKHNHGFFVRLQRGGRIHSVFFSDKKYAGRANALAAAQEHHRQLAAKLGTPVQMSRRQWAEIRRRRSRSGVIGVRYVVVRRGEWVRRYWLATWSPAPHVVARTMFSIRKYGAKNAKRLAIRARREGLRSME